MLGFVVAFGSFIYIILPLPTKPSLTYGASLLPFLFFVRWSGASSISGYTCGTGTRMLKIPFGVAGGIFLAQVGNGMAYIENRAKTILHALFPPPAARHEQNSLRVDATIAGKRGRTHFDHRKPHDRTKPGGFL
jgi:hypothetical protein